MTATRRNGQSDTVVDPSGGGLHELPDDVTEAARLRAELESLRTEYERAAASETALRLELARVERESEERAVRLMLAEERAAGSIRSQPRP